MPPRPVADWLRQRPIAHRGLHERDRPENSLSAFRAAVQANYAIELDIRACADGELVVIHDADLVRMTGRAAKVADVGASDLRSTKLLRSNETIPLLGEVLDEVDGKVPLLIEVKNEGRLGGVESVLAGMLSHYVGDYAVQAFNPFVLAHFRRHSPAILRGQLSGDFRDRADVVGIRKNLLQYLLLEPFARPDFVAYDVRALCPITPVLLQWRLSALRVPLLLWTIRTASEREFARTLGANLIFEGITP